MSATLSNAETALRRHRLTVKAFHRMGDAGIVAASERVGRAIGWCCGLPGTIPFHRFFCLPSALGLVRCLFRSDEQYRATNVGLPKRGPSP